MPKGDVYEKTGPSAWALRANIAGPPAGGLALVTSLPASPVDGQECYFLADATNGIVWHLRYRAAASGSYKWEFVGGPPLYSYSGLRFTAPDGTPRYATDNLPQVTVPLKGEYDFEIGFTAASNVAGGGCYMDCWALTDSVQPIAGGCWLLTQTNVIAWVGTGKGRWPLTTASQIVRARFAAYASTSFFDAKHLWITPVKVG